MLTVKTKLNQMTDVNYIMEWLMDTLRSIDPEFEREEAQFTQAIAYLTQEKEDVESKKVMEYRAAKEEELAMEIIYIGWEGFQLNMEIYKNPVTALMLREDDEDLHRERRLCTLPMTRKTRDVQSAFWAEESTFPEDKKARLQIIDEHYSYLQTAGYKLAHYFGFRLADHFLPYVIPGYISNPVYSFRYLRNMETNLQMDLSRIE